MEGLMKNFYLFILAVTILLVSQSFNTSAEQKIKTGDIVFAEWVVNGWYHGTAGNQCSDGGFMILFDDGDTKCCDTTRIVPDKIPVKSNVTVGASVIAQWSDGRFYPGTVVNIIDDAYSINFDDGDKSEVNLSQIRLRN
jgi:hypothetical protein